MKLLSTPSPAGAPPPPQKKKRRKESRSEKVFYVLGMELVSP